MKKLLSLAAAGIFLISCENPMQLSTKVYDDGSLDKTIILQKADSGRVLHNVFGISAQHGWTTSVQRLPSQKPDSANVASGKNGLGKNSQDDQKLGQSGGKQEYIITFQKHFADAQTVNAELDTQSDSLFHIHAQFEKKFRWFYTYIRYTETYRPINRFTQVDPSDYFNEEDSTFINRLPAEGKSISKADSLYLQLLNEKISDHFARMGIFKEEYGILLNAARHSGLDKQWMDVLQKQQDYIYDHVEKMQGDPLFGKKMADSLKLPIKASAWKEVEAETGRFNSRINFMSFARDGKYTNILEMPWEVVSTNADSVAGQTVYWHPLVNKFAIRDYTMFAESRKLNVWSLAVSGAILLGTVWLFMRKGRKRS